MNSEGGEVLNWRDCKSRPCLAFPLARNGDACAAAARLVDSDTPSIRLTFKRTQNHGQSILDLRVPLGT